METNTALNPLKTVKSLNELPMPENVTDVSKQLFSVKTANDWIDQAKDRPIPKKLFGPLWFEGEICILFADTNLGKSILAVQMAAIITGGKSLPVFEFEAEAQKVLYFDFELSDKQFELRYSSEYENHYLFSDMFFRIEINPAADIPTDQAFEDYLTTQIDEVVSRTEAKIIIIDNITYLKSENEKSKNALPLMKALKSMKSKHGLSVLILAHTPKRDLSKPLSRNDLAGSKMLINFCDSSFTIGESFNDKSLRYIKQIKSRASEIIFDSDNVPSFIIEKPDNFLRFSFVRYSTEAEHLKPYNKKQKEDRDEAIKELHAEGKSYREIGLTMGISQTTAMRILKKQKEECYTLQSYNIDN